ncbi:hypothetical protein ACJX0J_020754 [Zea mays]
MLGSLYKNLFYLTEIDNKNITETIQCLLSLAEKLYFPTSKTCALYIYDHLLTTIFILRFFNYGTCNTTCALYIYDHLLTTIFLDVILKSRMKVAITTTLYLRTEPKIKAKVLKPCNLLLVGIDSVRILLRYIFNEEKENS